MWNRAMPAFYFALLVCSFAIGGCSTSPEHYSFKSTEHLPTSVSVVRRHDSLLLWHMDVPINHRLDLRFSRQNMAEHGRLRGRSTERMTWSLHDEGGASARLGRAGVPRINSGEVGLANEPTRIMISYREQGHDGSPVPYLPAAQLDSSVGNSAGQLPPLPEEGAEE